MTLPEALALIAVYQEALRVYAEPKNWRCRRCGKHDPVNCYCSRWEGPLVNADAYKFEVQEHHTQPWGIAAEALKADTRAAKLRELVEACRKVCATSVTDPYVYSEGGEMHELRAAFRAFEEP